jgi:palmitoyltransferase ZDHHC9/14/18
MSGGKTLGVTSPTSPSRHHGTHVGGIQPSASFFRPSKPSDQQHFTTARHDPYPPSSDTDAFPLSSISQSHRHSASSEDQSLAHGGHDSLSMTDENFNTRKSNKSRDPLLPIGEKPTPLSSRPSMTRDLSGAGSTNTAGHTRSPTASNIVRNSLELVFNLRRGMSIDSIRRMGGSSNALASRVKADGDPKHFDEEEENRYPMGVTGKPSYADSAHSRTPSPAPSFLPSPPEPQNPPLDAVPIINPDTGKPYRNHELHPSRNRFFFGGRIVVGGDSPWAFIMTFSILLIITGTWFGTTCIWWWQNESPAVAAVVLYLALIVISSMLATAFRDPGILPRNLDPDPPFSAAIPQDGIRAPLPRDLKVRSDV